MPGSVLAGLGSPLSREVTQAVAALSSHIGSGASCPLRSAMQVNPFGPSFKTLSLPSGPGAIMAAFLEICAGAALIAVLTSSSSLMELAADLPCWAAASEYESAVRRHANTAKAFFMGCLLSLR